MIKAIFFDYHGVLDKRTFKGLLHILARHSHDPKTDLKFEEHLEKIIKKYSKLGDKYASGDVSSNEFWKTLKKDGFSNKEINLAKKYILKVEKNKGLWKLLPSLRQKYHIGILSDCPQDKTQLIRETMDLTKHFDNWFFSSDFKLTKNDMKFFRLMVSNGRFSTNECLFVDDSEKNVDFAKKLNFQGHVYRNNEYLKKLI